MRKDFSNTGPSLEGTEGKRALDEIRKSKKSHILVSNPMKRKHDEVDAPEISTEQGRKVATPMNKNLASPAHTPRSGGSEMVSCLMLREETWRSLVRGDTSPIYLFRSYALNQFPSTFHIIISDNAGTQCEHVGLITLDKCEQVKRFHPWKSFMLNVLESKTWANRVREREKVFAWRVATVTPLDNPIRIIFASGKFRNRHFTCKKKNLYQVMDLPAPAPSLFETAQFFMKLLPPRYQERLARVAGVMNKRILKVGTACSGSDICMVAIRTLLQAMNKEFNVSKQDHTECSKCTLFPTRTMIGETRATRSMQYIYRVINGVYIYSGLVLCVLSFPHHSEVEIGLHHIFSAEADKDKADYILAAHPTVEHLFNDCHCFEDMSGYCHVCGRSHQIDDSMTVDLHLCGPSCKDVSILEFVKTIYTGTVCSDALLSLFLGGSGRICKGCVLRVLKQPRQIECQPNKLRGVL